MADSALIVLSAIQIHQTFLIEINIIIDKRKREKKEK